MLKLREVSAFAPTIHRVVEDLLQRIELLRRRSHDGVTVSNLAPELYKFGFEGKRAADAERSDSLNPPLTSSSSSSRYLLHLV